MVVIMRAADTSTGVEYMPEHGIEPTEMMSEAFIWCSEILANDHLQYMEGEGWIVFRVR